MEIRNMFCYSIIHMLILIKVVNHVRGSPRAGNCMVTLTIPQDSIKSSCQDNDGMLRKMQSMEVQFARMRRKILAMETRFPQIMNDQSRYADTVKRVDFTLSQTGTYYKRLEERVHQLESRILQDENKHTDARKNVVSPDTLMDPVRPYIMAEMQKYKSMIHKTVKEEMVSKLFQSNDSFARNFKNDVIRELRTDFIRVIDSVSINSINDSSWEDKNASDSANNTYENIRRDKRVIDLIARSLRNISSNVPALTGTAEYDVKEVKGIEQRTVNNSEGTNGKKNVTSSVLPDESSSELESFIVNTFSNLRQEILQARENIENVSLQCYMMQENMSERIQESVEEIKNISLQHYNSDLNEIRTSVSVLESDLLKLERKVDEPLNDVSIDTKISQIFLKEKVSMQKSLTARLTLMVNALETKIDQQNKKINVSSNFVNIFKQTLYKQQNDSAQKVIQVEDKIKILDRKIGDLESLKLDNQVVTDKLKYLEDEIRSVVDSQLFTEGEIDMFKQSSNENIRENQNKLRELVNKLKDVEFKVNIFDGVKAVLGKQEIQDNVTLEKVKVVEKKLQNLEGDFNKHKLESSVGQKWVEYNFTDFSIRNDCKNKKYIKINTVSVDVAKYVGVQLCSPEKYKIFLGNSLDDEFYDIGDAQGFGEDHCQFVGAKNKNGPFKVRGEFVFMHRVYAYYRSHWDDPLQFGTLNMMRPTSDWYECGIKVP